MIFLSNAIVPLIFFIVIVHALLKKVDIFGNFLEGAKIGLETVFTVFPTLVGLLVAVSILRGSGFLDFIGSILSPITVLVGVPYEIAQLSVMRLFSAAAARGLQLDIFETYGPDSPLGLIASIIMNSTETVFYIMTVYFASMKITNTRYTLKAAILVNLIGVILSIIIVNNFNLF